MKLYIAEPGTGALLELAEEEGSAFALLSLTPVELRSAVRRRERSGELDSKAASEIIVSFSEHLETRFLRQPLTESTIDRALALVDRYTLRSYDAMQLAAYLTLRSTSREDAKFVCADSVLYDAARSEGAAAINPVEASV